jgi:anti-sigma factor RsiW
MNRDEARELFSAAHDGELDPSTESELRATLAADAALAEEFAAFERTLALARSAAAPSTRVPNLLPRVQRRLRMQSRGRFYGNRFAERAGSGGVHPLLLAGVLLALLGALWLALRVLDMASF